MSAFQTTWEILYMKASPLKRYSKNFNPMYERDEAFHTQIRRNSVESIEHGLAYFPPNYGSFVVDSTVDISRPCLRSGKSLNCNFKNIYGPEIDDELSKKDTRICILFNTPGRTQKQTRCLYYFDIENYCARGIKT
jgi:hypothetical protein